MVGEITYVYPLLACLEVYLWPPMPDTRMLYPLWVTDGYGTVHTGGSLILSVASDRLWQPIRTSGGSYAVALADRASEPTGLRGL
jgi:hypothetical protein